MLLAMLPSVGPGASIPRQVFFGSFFYLAAAAGVYYRARWKQGPISLVLVLLLTLGFQSASRMREKGLVSNWRGWLLLAGIAGGLALGTKHTAAAFMGPALAIFILWQMFRAKVSIKTALPPLLITALVSTLLFSPWSEGAGPLYGQIQFTHFG
jgi:4-amino-4-deoxy-L-arabinose transferase-like glycosyltransferase